VGVDIYPEHVRWGNYLLKQLAGHYDFVAPHYYCGADVHKLGFEEITLTENYRTLVRALKIQALLRAYSGGRQTCQYDTEWGMISSAPGGKPADYEDRNANIIGTVHRAVRLIYYAREDILRGASGWQMLSALNGQGFGILSQQAPEQRFLLYWLYYYFNRHVGEWVLRADGTAPYHQPRQGAAEFAGPLTPVCAHWGILPLGPAHGRCAVSRVAETTGGDALSHPAGHLLLGNRQPRPSDPARRRIPDALQRLDRPPHQTHRQSRQAVGDFL
jgi:hypothetical protein